MKSPRVFIGLVEVAGYYAGLARGLRELGVSVSHITILKHPYYGCAPAHGSWIIGASNWFTRLHSRAQGRRITRWPCKPLRWLQVRLLLLWAIAMHDVFVFSGGVTFLDRKELPLLKRLGKKLIFVFNGSDTRPPYMNGWHVSTPASWTEMHAKTARMKRMVIEIERYADACVNHPLSAQFHEKPFVNYIAVGNPAYLDIAARAARPEMSASRPVRVLHAPSRAAFKGTARFRAMVARLNARGLALELVELQNRPHQEVLDELARCDFVLDELYSDISLAGFGTEAASFGKAAVVGGYGKAALEQARGTTPLPLDTYCHPDEVEETLARLATDQAWREKCGETARRFVREHWQPRALAEKYLMLIEGTAPAGWFFHPQEIGYFHGWGIEEELLRRRLNEFIATGGVSALHLGDKPRLEQAIVAFAAATVPSLDPP